ncbi:MAG: gamma-glutamyl-gamma-aminobutyrate hydrolase family protein [Candidatus Cloacimonetes bacterium]|nr:gamma-glutamyl-gamma-aminobutyrate hydrolase family protein [Candidatus Cloacimonadota bacterium]
MKALIIDNHSKFIGKIIEALKDFRIKHSVIDFAEFKFEQSQEFDLFILSGGSMSIAETPELDEEKKLIANSSKPIFGICFGFQLIAFVFGENTDELPEKISGVEEVNIFDLDKLGIDHCSERLKVHESHKFVIKELPTDFDVFGNSKYGIEIFKHKTKPIWATQFHPEVRENNQGIIVLEGFLNKFRNII